MLQEYFGVRVEGAVRIAVPVADVEAVLQLHQQEICPIPGVAPFLLGVVNQRGDLVWVLQLSEFLGLPCSSVVAGSVLTAILVTSQVKYTDSGGGPFPVRRIACVVAELEGILYLDAQQLRPLPSNLKSQIRTLFSGIAYNKDMPQMVVLDSSALFSVLNSKSSTAAPL